MRNPNDKIGPYTLVKKIGEGGFGEVWSAENPDGFLHKKVAVKFPLRNTVDLEAVRAEAEVWDEVRGKNIIKFVEARNYDGQVVIVSELADGGSLADWLTNTDNRTPKDWLDDNNGGKIPPKKKH